MQKVNKCDCLGESVQKDMQRRTDLDNRHDFERGPRWHCGEYEELLRKKILMLYNVASLVRVGMDHGTAGEILANTRKQRNQ